MKKKTDLTSLKQVQKDKLTTSSVVPVISSYLTTAEKNALFTSNQTFYRQFKPHFILTSLLQYVVTGNQDKVIQILRSSPQFMVIQGCVTEKNSKRTFLKASAAELVRWCGDLRYMGNAMLDILKNLPDQSLAEDIRAKWVALDDAYDLNEGLNYMLPRNTEPTKSLAFSLTPLFNALQDYIDTFDTMNWAQRVEKWSTKVGAEQFLLTAKYLQDYCNPDVPFYPTPSFDAPTFPRCLEIYNCNTGEKMGAWGNVDKGDILGRNFGISRGWSGGGGAVSAVAADASSGGVFDLGALRACEERTGLDLIAFKTKLREPLNQQPVAEQKSSDCSIS